MHLVINDYLFVSSCFGYYSHKETSSWHQQQNTTKEEAKKQQPDLSFTSLRKLIGMGSDVGNNNNSDDNGTITTNQSSLSGTGASAAATVINNRNNNNGAFTSLRKLVHGGPSFCSPNKRSSTSSSSSSQNRRTASSSSGGGVFCDPSNKNRSSSSYYDDSDSEDDIEKINASDLFISMVEEDEDDTHDNNNNSNNTSDDLMMLSHHHTNRITTPSPVRIPLSPIPYSSDSIDLDDSEEEKKQTGDDDNKAVNRSIFQELEEHAASNKNTRKKPSRRVKVDTGVHSDDDDHDDEEDDDSKVEEPPTGETTPTVVSRGIQVAASRSKDSKRMSCTRIVLLTMVTILMLGFGGIVLRLHHLGKLENVVGHVQNGTLQTNHMKELMKEVSGTEDLNLTQQYVDLEDKVLSAYSHSQEHLQRSVEDILHHLEQWQTHLLEKIYTYQENLHDAWNSTIDLHHSINLTKYYADFERTMNATIALEMFMELSNSTWDRVETSILHLKEKIPTEVPSNLTSSLQASLGKVNLDYIHNKWSDVNSHIQGLNWSYYVDEIGTTVSSTIGEENIELFNNKVAEIELVFTNLRSNLTKYYNESTKNFESTINTAVTSEYISIINQTWSDVQGNISLLYEESRLKQYVQSSNTSFYMLVEKLFGFDPDADELNDDTTEDASAEVTIEVMESELEGSAEYDDSPVTDIEESQVTVADSTVAEDAHVVPEEQTGLASEEVGAVIQEQDGDDDPPDPT